MRVKKDSSFVIIKKDVDDQDIVQIATDAEEIEGQWGVRLQVGIKCKSGLIKRLSLNSTTKNILIDEFGDETRNWINKEVRVHILKSNVAGTVKDVIYLTHPNKDLEGNLVNE